MPAFETYIALQTTMLVARVAAPIVKSGWDFITGKEKKEEKKLELQQREKFNNDQKLREQDFEYRLKAAEAKFAQNINEWNMRKFYENCWPLRNPFEMPIGFELKYREGDEKIVEACKFKLLSVFDGLEKKEVIPCRIISALKDDSHPYAKAINTNLSSFILSKYSSNGLHAAISEIGAWRQDVPSNDASVNYLYTGLMGQPVMVLMPEFINNNTTLVFKVFAWGLGEELPYPCGFELGRVDLKSVQIQSIIEISQKRYDVAKRMGIINSKYCSKDLVNNISVISDAKEFMEKGIEQDDVQKFLRSYLVCPTEIEAEVERDRQDRLSGIFCAIAGLYVDTYHFLEYGTTPLLPSLLHNIPGSSYIALPLVKYYNELFSKVIEGQIRGELSKRINTSVIARSYVTVLESLSSCSGKHEGDVTMPSDVLSSVTNFLLENKEELGDDFKQLNRVVASMAKHSNQSLKK